MIRKRLGLVKLKSQSLDGKISEATGLQREQFEKKLRNRQIPTLILFYADVGCNQHCLHCATLPQANANLKAIERNIAIALKLDYEVGLYVTEPTLKPQVMELYNTLDNSMTITNGITAASMLQDFKKAGLDALGISLHGPDPETHALLTGKPENFERVVDTIRKARKRFYIQIEMVVHRENMYQLEEQLQYVKKLGVQELHLINLLKIGKAINLPEKMFLRPSDAAYVVEKVRKLKRKVKKPHISFAETWGPNFYSKGVYNWIIGQAYTNIIQSSRWCPAGKTFFTVIDKDVYPCPVCVLPELKIGRWDDEVGLQITKNFWKGELNDRLTGMCASSSCEYSYICQGGCRGMAYIHTQDFYGSPPFCLTKIIEQMD
ncbi:MAG: radical SAM protein [Candidatus Hodarchaeota archaeon]